jgi:hypothetical protein
MGGYNNRYLLKYLVVIVDPKNSKTIRTEMRAIQKRQYDAHACVFHRNSNTPPQAKHSTSDEK